MEDDENLPVQCHPKFQPKKKENAEKSQKSKKV